MSFEITHDLLLAVARRNLFALPENELIFFGLRGCSPLDPEDISFAKARALKTAEVNYLNPRCTLGQWNPQARMVAVFAGSTCPNRNLVISAKNKGGIGANQLLTGYYTFVKGVHHPNKPTGHQAFRQEEERVVLRNTDDMDFDFHDTLDRGVQFDNLHCAFSAGVNSGYSSAGCQVVVGFPTTNDHSRRESGPWAAFRQTAYGLGQTRFRYLLLRGSEVEAMAQNLDLARAMTIRFGSHGELVRAVQKRLFDLGLLRSVPDASCGPLTQMAIIQFQIARLGAESADGILGANTAVQLGLTDWPTVGKEAPVAFNGKPFVLDQGIGTGTQPKGAETFRFRGNYRLPAFAVAHFNAEAGVPWDGAQPIPDWNDYSGCVRDSGYAFPTAPVPALFYEAKFAIDADGIAPEAGGDPTGQNQTSLRDQNGVSLDSNHYPFIVLPLNRSDAGAKIPGRTVNQMGGQLGDLGVALFKNGTIVPVIYGDLGPALKLGEGSMMAARALGIDPNPRVGGIGPKEVPPGIVHLIFPGSTDVLNRRTKRTAQDVARDALALFEKFRTPVAPPAATAAPPVKLPEVPTVLAVPVPRRKGPRKPRPLARPRRPRKIPRVPRAVAPAPQVGGQKRRVKQGKKKQR